MNSRSGVNNGRFSHGHACKGKITREYTTWFTMLQRCRNPKDKGWKNYGGRGIKVCGRWLRFENFLADMGQKPVGMMIDRRNNDGNYEPGNCRWITRPEQNRNRRMVKITRKDADEIKRLCAAKQLTSRQIAERFHISYVQVRKIATGWAWA